MKSGVIIAFWYNVYFICKIAAADDISIFVIVFYDIFTRCKFDGCSEFSAAASMKEQDTTICVYAISENSIKYSS